MIIRKMNYFIEDWKDMSELSPFAPLPGAMINPQLLELPMSRTNFHGPKDVQAIEVQKYIVWRSLFSLK